ncbi:MAG: MFS transporter [Actinomycetota bacterium]|nr:MFS transporter [Actinomycetota bacterium]
MDERAPSPGDDLRRAPRAIDLLRERSPYRPFLGALTLSWIGDGISMAALLLYVEAIEGTGVAVGALLLTQTLPRLVGPLAGSVADRTDTVRLMIGCDLGQAAVYGAIAALLPSLGPLLGLVFIASVLQSGTSAARGAMLPALVGEERLLGANVLLGAGFNLQVAIGPILGGVLFASGGADVALAVNAMTFLVSAGLLALVRVPRIPREPIGGVLAEAREAFSFVWREPLVRTLVLSLTLAIAFLSLDNVALVFLVRDTFEASPEAYGFVFGAYGVGMLFGSLVMLLANPRSPVALFILALALSGSGTMLTGLAPALVAVAAVQALAGIGNSLDNAASDTLLQRAVPPQMLGRVFGLMAALAYAGNGIAAAVGGPLLDLTSPRFVFVVAGIGGLSVLAYTAPALRRFASAANQAPRGEA